MGKSFKTAKIVQLFLDECREYLDTLDQDLVSLEQGDPDEELLKRISRTLHTIKGSSAMVEFMDISNIAHHMEDVLDEFKKSLPDVDDDLMDQIFDGCDNIKKLVLTIENGTYGQDQAESAPAETPAAPPPQESKKPKPKPVPEPEKKPAPEPAPAAPAPAAEDKTDPATEEKSDPAAPPKKRKGLPDPPQPGRTNIFRLTGVEIRPILDRCYSMFSDIESKYVLADENENNPEFYRKLFSSVEYLHKSLVCFGEPTVNELLNRLLALNDAIEDGKVKHSLDSLDAVFKGVGFIKNIIEAAMKWDQPSTPPDIKPLVKSIHKIMAAVREQKDYLSIDSAGEIFKHLSVNKEIAKQFTPYEKRVAAQALIDEKNIYTIRMQYDTTEIDDLASMTEFFKPLSDEGFFVTAFILAHGVGSNTDYYTFHLLYSSALKRKEFNKKFAFLQKIGGIDISEMDLAHDDPPPVEEPAAAAPAAAKRQPQKAKKMSTGQTTVRVDTDKLDVLVNLIAELVINHNKLEQETKRMNQTVNYIGDMLDSVKFSAKSTGLAERNITLDELLKPFKNIQSDALELGDRRLDSKLLEHMKELREARENLVQLFDMGLEKETLTHDLLGKITHLKTDFDGLYHEFLNDALNIGRMIEELQDETMKLRMLPISGVFNKFPRRVRDIAKTLGKKIDFLIEGEDTELDKTLIEEIEEPLLHIIRNAVDHGVETTERRRQTGKNDKGVIVARAYHEGNSVVIEVEDDGGGMDPDVIKNKCVDKHLISKEDADGMSSRDALNLIFIPGFSTADQVSDLSGRGVGMDVVKNSISKLKGMVNVSSDVGVGTVFKLKLPLTLAIIQAMIVKCGGQKFVIPMDPIESTEQVSRYDVHFVEGKEVYRFQDMVIPLINLRDVYNLEAEEEKKTGTFPVVIVAQVEKKIGLVVDEVVEKQQVVIKSLGDFLGDVKHISGATIFGDGSIAMILDVAGIIHSVPYLAKRVDHMKGVGDITKDKHVLLVDDSLSGRIAQREMLENIGYIVDAASSGMQAIAKLGERKFDVIVTDINMPRMNGYEFTQKVRQMPDIARTPIIMVTSDVKSADRNKAFEVGINEFLGKPFSEEDLKIAIDKHLRYY